MCSPTPPFCLSTPPPAWPSGGYAVAKTVALFPCHAPSALTRGAVPRGKEVNHRSALGGPSEKKAVAKRPGKGAHNVAPSPSSMSPWPSPLPVSCGSLATQLSGRAQLREHPRGSALLPLALRGARCSARILRGSRPTSESTDSSACAQAPARSMQNLSTVLYMYKMSSEMGAFVPTWRRLLHLHLPQASKNQSCRGVWRWRQTGA